MAETQIKIRKGNEVLYVNASQEDHYVNRGFNVIEENGTIIRAAIPNTIGELQLAYIEKDNRIKALESQVAELTAQLTTKKAKKKSDEVTE